MCHHGAERRQTGAHNGDLELDDGPVADRSHRIFIYLLVLVRIGVTGDSQSVFWVASLWKKTTTRMIPTTVNLDQLAFDHPGYAR